VTRHDSELSGNEIKWLGEKSKSPVLMGERIEQSRVSEMRITPAIPFGHEVVRCIFIVASARKFNCNKNGNPDHSCLQALMPDQSNSIINGNGKQPRNWKRVAVGMKIEVIKSNHTCTTDTAPHFFLSLHPLVFLDAPLLSSDMIRSVFTP
jgi:hypothetical protein